MILRPPEHSILFLVDFESARTRILHVGFQDLYQSRPAPVQFLADSPFSHGKNYFAKSADRM